MSTTMSRYRIAINLEWTSKCNARCIMCPREAVTNPRAMDLETLRRAVSRLSPQDVFRVVIAGYGEPTTHPQFEQCLQIISAAPVPVDLISNGQLLDPTRLGELDGIVRTLTISFSSVDPEIYGRVHANLDQSRVMENIRLAQNSLRHTRLAISLTPLAECIETLPQTIAWLRTQGVEQLSMSPSLYDRAGALHASDSSATSLRSIIRRYGLRSQELDFVPSLRDIVAQWYANRFKCLPRNSDLVIAADGSYQYCFNDMGRSYPLGHVADMSIREALAERERTAEEPALCRGCNIRGRYRPLEILQAAIGYLHTPRS